MQTITAFLDRQSSVKRGLYGSAFLRLSLSIVASAYYIWEIPIRAQILGLHGMISRQEYLSVFHPYPLFLYRYATTPFEINAIFWGSLLTALLFAIGFKTRWVSWLFFITLSSNLNRGGLASDGGRNLLLLMSFLLCFADSSQYFSAFRTRRGDNPIGVALHNCAYFLIRWQVCMVYFWAVFYKLGGQDWRNGTALAYILSTEHFMWFPEISRALSSQPIPMALATYGTLMFQSAFPFLMWSERIKPYVVGLGATMHLCIAILMGLPSFSATTIACDIAVLSDRQFSALLKFRLFHHFGERPENVTHTALPREVLEN